MNLRPTVCLIVGALAAALFTIAPCRADLFALSSSTGTIFQIDSNTLEITRTIPPFIPGGGPSPFSSLAFDGQWLSWTRGFGLGSFNELQLYDVVHDSYVGPFGIYELFPEEAIAGLGAFLGDGTEGGPGGLLAVTRSVIPPGTVPPAMYAVSPFGVAVRVGELPVEYSPLGLDIDHATGEIWIAAQNTVEGRLELLQINLPGFTPPPVLSATAAGDEPQKLTMASLIQRVLTPTLPPGSPLRGLAFDGGRMYGIGVTGLLHEFDRNTGEVLRSVDLPVDGLFGGLTGGTIVPEPGSALLLTIGALMIGRYPRRKHR